MTHQYPRLEKSWKVFWATLICSNQHAKFELIWWFLLGQQEKRSILSHDKIWMVKTEEYWYLYNLIARKCYFCYFLFCIENPTYKHEKFSIDTQWHNYHHVSFMSLYEPFLVTATCFWLHFWDPTMTNSKHSWFLIYCVIKFSHLEYWCIMYACIFKAVMFSLPRIVYNRCQDICESVRTSIINTLFDETFLELYSTKKLNQQIVRLNVEGHLQKILQSEAIDKLIGTELHNLAMSPEGQLLSSTGIKLSSLRPLVKPYVVEVLTDVVPVIMEQLSSYARVGKLEITLLAIGRYTFWNWWK